VRFWHNHSGYCSKQCRTDSITSCPNCGKVGLYKHARLGCCSEECRYWYVASLLGYDKEALVTPAWDKIVYHVRLPSTSAEISSLQLDELEYDRAIDTVLVIAAPPWMTRSKVLAELPYERFDNGAWQHLWLDGTLTEDELFRFHRACYDDDLLCQKLGEHVFAKLRSPAPSYSAATPPPGFIEAPSTGSLAATRPMALPQQTVQARLAPPAAAPHDFVASVRALFAERGYAVEAGAAENTLLLRRNGRLALAAYQHHTGMVDVDPVQRAYAAAAAAGATQTFVVTNGHFTLQAEDFASTHPIQLIDGDEMAGLSAQRREMPTVSPRDELTPALNLKVVGNDLTLNGDHDRAEATPAAEPKGNGNSTARTAAMAPLDAEIVGGEGALS
jgi:hypothetical protein